MTTSRHRTWDDLVALGGHGFGVSTGYMEAERGDWPRLLVRAGQVSHRAIELSALSGEEMPGLIRFLDQMATLDFDYVSVHGPAKGWSGTGADLATELNTALPAYVDAVVLHPETLDDLAPFSALGELLILENMDSHKHSARTAEELSPYFEALPEAGFCFDVAHAQMNDPSMDLAHELIDAFGDRLREVHLSSIANSGRHVPLAPSDIDAFWPVLERCIDVPWVLEAAPPGPQKIA